MFETNIQILNYIEKHFCFDDKVPGALYIGSGRGTFGTSWIIQDERKIREFLKVSAYVSA